METKDYCTLPYCCVYGLAYEGIYIVAGLYTSPGWVFYIDPTDMSIAGGVELVAGDDYVHCLVHGGGSRIYAGLWTAPAVVVEIDVGVIGNKWTGGGGDTGVRCLAYDGSYIYAGLWTTPAVVVKIDPATMNEVDRWTGGASDWGVSSLTYDGTNVYAAINSEPHCVVKLDPSTMSEVDRWTGTSNEAAFLTNDGSYVYIGVAESPCYVIKLDPSTMSEVDRWTGTLPDDEWITSMAYDGTYIYAGLYQEPGIVIQFNPSDMMEVDRWTGETGQDNVQSLTNDGTNVYAGLDTDPGYVFQMEPGAPPTYTLTTHVTGSGSITKNPDKEEYDSGDIVELTANPAEGWGFDHWEGDLSDGENPKNITMDSDKEVTAVFVPLYHYTLTANVVGRGTVTKDPDKPDYDPSEVVKLTSDPDPDRQFSFWSGDLSGSDNPKNITMDSDKVVTATFKKDPETIAVWEAEAGLNDIYDLVHDGTFLYAAIGYSSPASLTVVKVYPLTMAPVATWNDTYPGTTGVRHLYHDGNYLYAFVESSTEPNRIFKIDPITMVTMSAWTAPDLDTNSGGITGDGTFIYAGNSLLTPDVYKINPVTMTTVDTWTGPTNIGDIMSVTYLDGFIYAGTYLNLPPYDPFRVYKVNAVTMTHEDVFIGSTGEKLVRKVINDGSYIYVGLGDSPGTPAIKINPATMTLVERWTGDTGEVSATGISLDSAYLYVSLANAPTRVVRVARGMFKLLKYIGVDAQALCVATGSVFVGTGDSPGKMLWVDFDVHDAPSRSLSKAYALSRREL